MRVSWLLLLSAFLFNCKNKLAHKLELSKKLKDYPSASAIEYVKGQIFLLGDDANYLAILDSNLNQTDSIQLYSYPGKRIPKDLKADLETLTTIRKNKENFLLALGSGTTLNRNKGWLINLENKQKDSIQLDSFYSRLRQLGIKEINIEGCADIQGVLFLINRGNKGYPKNFLIKTRNDFWIDSLKPIDVIRIGVNLDTNSFQGVSGMDYAPVSDRLILTVSTEDTKSVYEDGAIGKSYLWIVEYISSKRDWLAINPDQVIDLEEVDPQFKGQKIESVAVQSETKKELVLLLAADNDDGTSTLFKLKVEKK